MIIARGAAQLYSDGRPIDASSEAFTWIADVNIFGLPGLVLLYILIVIASHILLSRSTFGRHVYAVGGNLNAAKICGINTNRTLIWVYILGGALSEMCIRDSIDSVGLFIPICALVKFIFAYCESIAVFQSLLFV